MYTAGFYMARGSGRNTASAAFVNTSAGKCCTCEFPTAAFQKILYASSPLRKNVDRGYVVEGYVVTDAVDVAARQGVGPTHGLSSAASSQTADAPLRLYRNVGKRTLDVAAVIVLAPLVAPLVVLLSFLIALDGGAPLFRQKRLGRDGRVFTILKLRTMVPDAERALRDLIRRDPGAAAEWKERQKLRQDPRVTRLGAFLRRTSLDELPQLWNVLRGDMSLVGPRPMMPDQRSLYPGHAYYTLRPGITGLWQVSERNDNTFASRAGYDEVYAAELSLKLDVATLARTVVVVMRGTGC